MQHIPLGRLLVLVCSTLIFGCKHPIEAAQESALATKQAHLAYSCDNHMVVQATYNNRDPAISKVMLSISGIQYHLTQVMTGSGVKYVTKQGLTEGHGLIWYSKGRDAVASSYVTDAISEDQNERVLFTCQSQGSSSQE